MGLARLMGHAKRKFRVILIFLLAVTLTATIAFYNSQAASAISARAGGRPVEVVRSPGGRMDGDEEKYKRKIQEDVEKAQEKAVDEVEEKKPIGKETKSLEEVKGNEDEERMAVGDQEEGEKKTSTTPRPIRQTVKSVQQSFQNTTSSSSSKYPLLNEFVPEYDTADIYKKAIASKSDYNPGKNRQSTEQKLRVFILPFTHVDPGWLRTFDSYSEDTNQILTNMHSFMMKNEAMRFMWAEFVFFERWWIKQNQTVKDDVKLLVKEGRLELASGSWVMTDEANAYFPVSVDNIIEGHQFLQREFGIQPSTIWSNDPFGYSNSVPYIFRQTGIKRNVINRIHHGIKGFLQNHKSIPFQWRQYFDKTGESDVLTQVLPYTHYDILNSCGPNPGSCCEFDFKRITHWSCPGPKPVPITKDNVKAKAATLVGQLKTMSRMYEAPVMLQMHGDDFRFDMIEEWHQQHDNFIPVFEEINKGNEVQISFGTFNDYFTELENYNKERQVQPAVLTGDFFPYQCALGDLWTGYFTTRPFYKRQGRLLHSLIRSGDLLSSLAHSTATSEQVEAASKTLEKARRTLSLFQHHDAITGTSKIHVMQDYSKLLFEAQNGSLGVIESSLKNLLSTDVFVSHSPELFNETQTKHQVVVENSQSTFVSVFNPLPYSLVDTVSIRVNTEKLSVIRDGQPVKAQIEPYIFKGDIAQKSYLLTFAVQLSPIATTVFEVKAASSPSTSIAEILLSEKSEQIKEALPSIFKTSPIAADGFQMKTSKLSTKHHPETGSLQEVTTGAGQHSLNTSFFIYRNARGGAYLMRVSGEPQRFTPSSVPTMLVKGPIQQSMHSFMGQVYQRVTAKDIEGPLGEQLDIHVRIDITKEKNTEVFMRVETDLSEGRVFADSVGMQLLHRESHSGLSVEANYYPMPSSAVIDDDTARLTVSSNVEHGMMALKNGFEINIDRMLNQDDGKGLGSSADAIPTDLLPVDMQFSLLLEKKSQKDSTSHYTSHTPHGHVSVQNILYPPSVVVSSAAPKQTTSAVQPLPCDYQLLTVRSVAKNQRLVTIFRHGVAAGAETGNSCGTDATASVCSLLASMKASKVQISNLAGTSPVGSEVPPSEVQIQLEPFHFLSLLVTISS